METAQRLARRAACDRCRSQKLRCVRPSHHNEIKCKRCENAGTTCHYSISKPAGRPSSNGSSSNTSSPCISSMVGIDAPGQQRPNENGREVNLSRSDSRLDQRPSDTDRHPSLTGNREVDGQEPSEPEAMDQNSNGPASFATDGMDGMAWSPTTTAQANGWPTTQQPILIPSIPHMPNLSLPGFPGEDCNWWAYDSTGFGGATCSSASWESLSQAGSAQSFPWAMPWHSLKGHSDPMRMTPIRPSMGIPESAMVAPITPGLPGLKDDYHTQSLASTKLLPESSVTHSAQKDIAAGQAVVSDSDSPTGPHKWMQQFSELNLRLYQLATASSTFERDMSRPGKPAPFPMEFAGQVVDVSSAFLDLLHATGAQAKEEDGDYDTDHGQNRVRSRGHYRRSFPDLSSDSSGEEHSSAPRSKADTHRHYRRDPGNPGRSGKPGKTLSALTDITTLLQLLACYLRLRDLHSLLYTAIHQHMTFNASMNTKGSYEQHLHTAEGLPEETGEQPPLFKGLQIGGTSLESFHPFQVKFVLQITVHILGEIELTLGLPSMDRVSKKQDDDEQGILGTSISPQLLKTVMRDHAVPGGRGGPEGSIVLVIRERLSQLRKLLRGSINL